MDDFEWDESKARANLAKHGIDFADAIGVFNDPRALTIADDHAGEERYVCFGLDAQGRIVGVVYTWRGDTCRIISARKATRSETRFYEARDR